MELTPQDFAKFACAYRAAQMVENGMKLGLGTGSTAAWLVKALAHRMRDEDLRFDAASTSVKTAELSESLGITITALDDLGRLDLTIDGADEFDPDLNLIKGAGAALLVEKIVATASDRMVVITDRSKQVETLGGKFPVPVEVIQYGHKTTARLMGDALERIKDGLGGNAIVHRMSGDRPLVTDEGHYIYDLSLNRIENPKSLSDALLNIAGVVETGLFLGIADQVIIGDSDGSTEIFGTSSNGVEATKEELMDVLGQLDI
ncbi:MAG: ribose-5-phosphate isomerase RpiA [Pseudomonadota bacterium]